MRILLLAAFLLTPVVGSRGAELSLQEQYLQAYLLINEGHDLEKNGYLQLAYTIYTDILQKLVLLHKSNGNIEQGMYKEEVSDLQVRLQVLKAMMTGQGPPIRMDDAYRQFIQLDLNTFFTKPLDWSNNIADWKEFQSNHPDWEPKLIAGRIAYEEMLQPEGKALEQAMGR